MHAGRCRLPVALLLAAAAAAQELRLPLDAPDATWRGVTAIGDGAVGAAARFDGDGARIDCGPCPVDGRQPFTLRLQLRTRHAGFCTPLMARQGDAVGVSIVLGRRPGCVSFEAWSWQQVKLIAEARVDDGRWHAIEVAYEPATTMAVLLVDGVLQAAGELGDGGSPAAELRLGDNIGAHQPFAGDLDEVQFERKLAQADLLAALAPVLPLAERRASLQQWRERLLPRSTPSLEPAALRDWPARRLQVRRHVADCLGLLPEPARPPLDVQVHGSLRGDGFTVQRLSFAAWQHSDQVWRAGGWLWRPDPQPPGRLPAVLCPHGHWAGGAIDPVVQARCALFARQGWLVLAVDSVHVEDVAAGVSSIGTMSWHNLRGLELLAARDDVDRSRIAVTGASGGGQQTYYLMALSDLPAAAAPVCMACYFAGITADESAHCGCNHPPRIACGTDVIEMCAVLAPKPVLFGSVTGDWTATFPQHGLPELQRLWQHLGAGGQLHSRHADEGHNYDRPMREAVLAFLRPVLARGGQAPRGPAGEAPFTPLPSAALLALGGPKHTPPPQALLAAEALARRPRVDDLRQLAPKLPWRVAPAAIEWRGGEALPWRPASVRGQDGVPVPFVLGQKRDPQQPWIVVGAEAGKAALLLRPPPWLSLPNLVLVDVRQRGEWARFAAAWRRNGLLLGCGEGYTAAHDLALVAASLPGEQPVTAVGLGQAGIEALLAAAIAPRIARVVTDDFGRDYGDDGDRLPFCPELERFGGAMRLAREVEGHCELRLGGTARAGGSPDRRFCAPLDADALLLELLPRAR